MSIHMNKFALLVLLIVLSLSLAACGGGGEDDPEVPTKHITDPDPNKPIAKSVTCGTTYPAPAGC